MTIKVWYCCLKVYSNIAGGSSNSQGNIAANSKMDKAASQEAAVTLQAVWQQVALEGAERDVTIDEHRIGTRKPLKGQR